jgi:3-dehydroquinate synthase
MRRVHVDLGERSYDVLIEPGMLASCAEHLADACPARRLMLVMDANVVSPHGETVTRSLQAAGCEVVPHVITAAEEHKTLDAIRDIYAAMLAAKLDRQTTVIALGGGVTGDMAGFVAATFLRGVRFIQIPTTLLAMVDASVGGKTGVNFPLPQSDAENAPPQLGKNLIGAFWQPDAVLIDPQTLGTLDARDVRCGLAECIKHGMITDAELIVFIERNLHRIVALDAQALAALIHWAVQIKARIVECDERETDRRALLNLGHTFCHVIEPIKALDLRHGEAVAVGLCAASNVAVQLGRMTDADAQHVRRIIEACGLPTRITQTLDPQQLVDRMQYDKKTRDGHVRLVIPYGFGHAEILDRVDEAVLRRAWRSVMGAEDADG